jgi:hypothetical protein
MSLVDNLPTTGEFGSPVWDALLTATIWGDRKLGVSEDVLVPNRDVWIVTGNNVNVRGDTTRRVIHMRAETPLEHPERRDPSTFRHPDLRGWVMQERGRLIWAVLTVLRAWIVTGRPTGSLTLGSYESWSSTVAACVEWLAMPNPISTQTEYEARHGTSGDAGKLKPLILAWKDAFESRFDPERGPTSERRTKATHSIWGLRWCR